VKTPLFLTGLLFLFVSGCIPISQSEKRRTNHIHGPGRNAFLTQCDEKIEAENVVDNYRLVIKKTTATAASWTLFAEDLSKYKRGVEVYELAHFDRNDLTPVNESFATVSIMPAVIYNFINSRPGKSYTLLEIKGRGTDKQYFSGVLLQRQPCGTSTVKKIETNSAFFPGNISTAYTNKIIVCQPQDGDSILVGFKKNQPVYFGYEEKVPDTGGKKPALKSDTTSVPATRPGFGFDHACDAKCLFNVWVVPNSGSGHGLISISDTLEGAKPVHHNYKYGNSFDEVNYLSELTRLYGKKATQDCLKYLVSRIREEILWNDSIYLRNRAGRPDTTAAKDGAAQTKDDKSNKKDDTGEKKPADQKGKPARTGKVRIIPLPAYIMTPQYSSTSIQKDGTLPIRLEITGSFDTTQVSDTVHFTLLDTSALSNKLKLLNTQVTIDQQTWENAESNNNGIYDLKLHYKVNSLTDSIEYVQKDYIILSGDTLNSQEVQLRSYNPNKPFWVEFGANFDLLDKLQTNNLYGAVIMHKRDVASLGGKRNITLFGGVYEAKTVSNEQAFNFANFQYLDNTAFAPPSSAADTAYIVRRDTGTMTRTTTVTNLGLFISPQIRLTNGSADANGLHVFASLWVEMVWQRSTTTYDYSKTGHYDSFLVPRSAAVFNQYSAKPTTLQGDFRSHFFGLGLPLYLKSGNANLYLNSVIGISNQPGLYYNTRPDTTRDVESMRFFQPVRFNLSGAITWRPFYLFQFRLNEEKFGISFTGEVRGTLARDYKPYLTLALSKKFDLTKLLEFK
jgi:hypothetical protein